MISLSAFLLVLALVLRVQCTILFDWRTGDNFSRFEMKTLWEEQFGRPSRLCSLATNMNPELVPGGFGSTAMRTNVGSFRVQFSRPLQSDTTWSSLTVSIAKLAGLVINDNFLVDNNGEHCENSVCILVDNEFVSRVPTSNIVSKVDERLTFAASWNITETTPKLRMMSFFVNGVKLAVNTSVSNSSLLPPLFLMNSSLFTVFCRNYCRTCLESLTIWDTVEVLESPASTSPPAVVISAATPSASTTTTATASTTSTTSNSTRSLSTSQSLSGSSSSILSLNSNSTSASPSNAGLIGGAVGGSIGLLLVLIGVGWLVFALRRRPSSSSGSGSAQLQPTPAQSEYCQFPQQPQYDDVGDVRKQ
jgi:hypothetical protein